MRKTIGAPAISILIFFGMPVVLVGCQNQTAESGKPTATAQILSPEDLSRQTIQRRGVEAAVWGMPAVSMAGVRKSLAGIGADYNQIVYFSKPLEARHEFLTANNQTPYLVTVLDTHNGPVVVEVPPASSKVALFGSAIDSWEVPLVDLGPTGEDAGKGGKYLFLPPGFKGSHTGGYITVPSPTFFVHVALRPIIVGKGTLIARHLRSIRSRTQLIHTRNTSMLIRSHGRHCRFTT
jgi:hypothetical protein